MRTKDMSTGTVAVTGRGFSNRVVVIVRPEAWALKHSYFGTRSIEFSKGKSGTYQTTNGVLAIETSIHTGSAGYFYGIDFDEPKIKKAIARAVAEAHRLAALSDADLTAELNAGSSAPSGKYGQVDVLVTGNITHTIEQYAAEVIEQNAARERNRQRQEEIKNVTETTQASLEASFAKLGFTAHFSVDAHKITIYRAQEFATLLAELAEAR